MTDEENKIVFNTKIKENQPFENDYFKAKLLLISKAQFENEIVNDRAFFQFQSPKSLLPVIQGGLDIKIDDPSAKTIRVKFQHDNAKLTSDIVNQLLIEYDYYVKAKKTLSSENILTFIKEQKDTVDKRVKESEQMIQLFQRSNDLKGTSGFSSSYLAQLSEMEQQYANLEVEKTVLFHLENSIKNFNEETNIDEIVPALIGRSFESTLQSLIMDLKTKIDIRRDMLSTATLDNSKVKKLIPKLIHK